MKRQLTLALFLAAMFSLSTVPAMAKGSFLNELKKRYPDPKISKTLTCAICHPGGDRSKLTLFGQDFKKQTGTTAEKIAKLEKLDSDKDKFTNLEEIKAGSDPSDPKSTPKNVKAAPADAKTTSTLTKTGKKGARTDAKTTTATLTSPRTKSVKTAPAAKK